MSYILSILLVVYIFKYYSLKSERNKLLSTSRILETNIFNAKATLENMEKKYLEANEVLSKKEKIIEEANKLKDRTLAECHNIKNSANLEKEKIIEEANKLKDRTLAECHNIKNSANLEKEKIIEEANNEISKKNYYHDISINNSKLELAEERKIFDTILNSKAKDFPFIADIFSDIKKEKYNTIKHILELKKRPALKASEVVKELKKEQIEITNQLYTHKYINAYYENLFPWLTELLDSPIIYEKETIDNNYQNDDSASHWLTKDEFSSLSNSKKYQLALDRYVNRKKSNQEIGRDYERYIGYCYEQKGFKVYYQGIIKGLEDLGRDLICTKDGCVHIVQCKCWSQNKTIHEKHINQLFGTTVMHYLTEINPKGTMQNFYKMIKNKEIVPVFVTSTTLSETARLFSKSLGIDQKENYKLTSYPMIKCNINKNSKEKIYHLPFDQQYDKIVIDDSGEFYAHTIEEAEIAGFRRAARWLGSS